MVIAYPGKWASIGQEVTIKQIEDALDSVLSSMNVSCIAYSGGLDSSLLLWFMRQRRQRVWAFTIGSSLFHPDVQHAEAFASQLGGVIHKVYIPSASDIADGHQEGDLPGDSAVRLFYKYVADYTNGIITGDGIDELMCGYYAHQWNPTEETYYEQLERLVDQQLRPLDQNSQDVKVYLPYLSPEIVRLLTQIPVCRKVSSYRRKLLMVKMAQGKLPESIIERRKYGFCDAFQIKETANATA